MNIDFTKPLQMRDGRKVRLLCTDKDGDYPIMCLFEDTKNVCSFTFDGRIFCGGPIDLMNVPEEVTVDVWVNIYPKNEEPLWAHLTKWEALKMASSKRLATIHIKRTIPVGHVDE